MALPSSGPCRIFENWLWQSEPKALSAGSEFAAVAPRSVFLEGLKGCSSLGQLGLSSS